LRFFGKQRCCIFSGDGTGAGRQNSAQLFPEVQIVAVLLPCDYSWAYPVLFLSLMICPIFPCLFSGVWLVEIYGGWIDLSTVCCVVGH
jgi:hypothetical protein